MVLLFARIHGGHSCEGNDMQLKKQLLALTMALLLMIVGMVAAYAQGGGDRASCSDKAAQTLENLDQWVVEYERQMASAEPVQKPKYQEWIRELKKLRTLVADARKKLEDKAVCPSEECVADQCGLIDIADQQVAQLIKETEEQLGEGSRFGEETGREVLVDNDTLGNDEILDSSDPEDARDDSYSDQSDSSDSQGDGQIGGNAFDDGSQNDLPAEDPADVASPS
jgi:hypothetical protein